MTNEANSTNSTNDTKVTATNFRRSTIDGCESGIDADVIVVRSNGEKIETEVTLLPAEDGRDAFETWGSCASCWLAWTSFTESEIEAIQIAVENSAPRPSAFDGDA